MNETLEARNARQLDVLRHALGTGADGRGHPYRNHFVTGEGSTDYGTCMELVEAGYMARHQGNALSGGDWIFTATGAGRAAAEPWDPPFITPGTREANMVVVETALNGKPTVWCDPEIADLVRALNAGGVRTVASCSGHGESHGFIALADGRELAILPDFETARRADPLLGAIVRRAEEIAVYQLASYDAPREWQDTDKATFDWWQGRSRRTRVVYLVPPPAKPAPRADAEACPLCDRGVKRSHHGPEWCEACNRTGIRPAAPPPATAEGMASRPDCTCPSGDGSLRWPCRKHPPSAEHVERCESGDPACGPVEHHDSEGVPLCAKCWASLTAEGSGNDG